MNILGICGSLRKDSYNMAALRAAAGLVPQGVTLTIYDALGDLPVFNPDHEASLPDSVMRLKHAIRSADAIVFATPEYNYSLPGVLKNAIDWGSRPYGDNSWEGKPVAIMSASPGMLGGIRAQYHLRQIFVFLDMHPLNKPEVIIGNAHEKFDAAGTLIDLHTKEKLSELLVALSAWTKRLTRNDGR